MLGALKVVLTTGAIVAGASVVCPLCVTGTALAPSGVIAQAAAKSAQATDTASVRFHISGMFCATCPVTARVALSKAPGVYSAKVTIDDSLGVVRYDPRKTTPDRIAAELKRMTEYTATVLPDSGALRRKTRGA